MYKQDNKTLPSPKLHFNIGYCVIYAQIPVTVGQGKNCLPK